MQTFVDELQKAMQEKRSVLCVGLDPQLSFMPPHLIDEAIRLYGETEEAIGHLFLKFNCAIIDAVAPHACCIKPNAAFYERSSHTWRALERTIAYAEEHHHMMVIKDAKRFDGGDTADAYAQAHIGGAPFFHNTTTMAPIRTAAMTIGGYIAEDCIARFIKEMKEYGSGAFVVDKTSFKPNSVIEQLVTKNGLTVWEELAKFVAIWGQDVIGENSYSNLGVVMGATYPEDAIKMRAILPKTVFLVPGYGAQGGGADGAVTSFNDDGFGAIVNSSRGILAAWQKGDFAVKNSEDFFSASATAAEFAQWDLNEALKKRGIMW